MSSLFPKVEPLPSGLVDVPCKADKIDNRLSKILSKDLTEDDLVSELLSLYGKVKEKVSESPNNAKICVEIIAQIRKAKHWDKDDAPLSISDLYALSKMKAEGLLNNMPIYTEIELVEDIK